ncbi:MAG: hypothetical protein KF799_07865 [Bdellovibrionales bacterium]|nr:hypothetical protein [Bdellovibrionales bacterium]
MSRFQLRSMICATLIFVTSAASANDPIRLIIYGRFRADLDPTRAYNPYEFSLGACIHPRLFRLDNQGGVQGELAESWKLTDSGKKYHIRLRKQSGFVAKDVIEWIKMLMERPDSGFHRKLLVDLLEHKGVSVGRDSSELVFSLRKPYAAFVYLLSSIEFQIPKERWPKDHHPDFLIERIAANKRYLVTERQTKRARIVVDVVDEPSVLGTRLMAKDVDLVIGLTARDRLALNEPEGYDSRSFNSLNSVFFEMRESHPIFAKSQVRIEVAHLLKEAAAKLSTRYPIYASQARLMPSGLLPPSYYQGKQVDSTSREPTLLARELSGQVLRIWLPSNVFPEIFKKDIETAFTWKGRALAQVDYRPLKEVVGDRKSFDIIATDTGSFFSDPDSFLHIWSLAIPNSFFPFPGEKLLKSLQQVRHDQNMNRRLGRYASAIRKFEDQQFVVPVFILPELVLQSKVAHIQLPAYRYADNLCRALQVL